MMAATGAEPFLVDDYLVRTPSRTLMLPVKGDSMIDAGIHEGDIVVVERAAAARSGDFVIAIVDDEFTRRRRIHPQGIGHRAGPFHPQAPQQGLSGDPSQGAARNLRRRHRPRQTVPGLSHGLSIPSAMPCRPALAVAQSPLGPRGETAVGRLSGSLPDRTNVDEGPPSRSMATRRRQPRDPRRFTAKVSQAEYSRRRCLSRYADASGEKVIIISVGATMRCARRRDSLLERDTPSPIFGGQADQNPPRNLAIICPGGHPNSPSDGHFKIPQ